MQRCSEKAYSVCPGREACGPIEDAVFQDGSYCQIFNDSIKGIVDLRPLMPSMLRTGDPCPFCGQPIKTTDPVLLRLLTCIRDAMDPDPRTKMEDDYGTALSGD